MKIDHESLAVVTGGASGLGLGVASLLRERGAPVAILDVSADLEAVAERLGAVSFHCDVSDAEAIASVCQQLVASLGAPRIVVNCAGIAPAARTLSRKGPHDAALFAKTIGINLTGSFLVASVLSEAMASLAPLEDNERGVIINTASVAAYDGQTGQVAYAASKGGIVGLTLPMARDLSSLGIRVCAVAPGIFATPMLAAMPDEVQQSLADQVPFPKRLGVPEDFSALVQHIVENRMINGEVIRLDGAIRMGAK